MLGAGMKTNSFLPALASAFALEIAATGNANEDDDEQTPAPEDKMTAVRVEKL
jgi:hypothetical protein